MKEELQPIDYKKYDVEIGAIYQHYKGHIYKVIAVARHSETLDPLVVYAAPNGEGDAWARPIKMWNDVVDYQGKQVQRFTKIKKD